MPWSTRAGPAVTATWPVDPSSWVTVSVTVPPATADCRSVAAGARVRVAYRRVSESAGTMANRVDPAVASKPWLYTRNAQAAWQTVTDSAR
jgi:hypothetical protein